MRNFYLLLIAVLMGNVLLAQEQKTNLTIQIQNEQALPVEAATVELWRKSDSALVKIALTDKNGQSLFEQLPFNTYYFKVSALQFAGYTSTSFELNTTDQQLPPIKLSTAVASQMQGVVVTAKKPFIQKLSDRIVVNVENSIVSAGSSALDILERSPGVTVDQNDAISLRGRAGVIIMIDGKPTPMAGADLANYLRGLPSNAIERIDIITNPSAKYDAAGNSGIIDIRMKKDQRLGMNGTFTAGYGQGVYPKANTGATWNYRSKAMNIFGNYNYAYRENLNHLIINRNFYENGVFIGSDDKNNYAWMPFNSHTARIGADFFPSRKTIIGFVVNSSFNRFKRKANINTMVNDQNFQPDFKFLSLGTNNDHFENAVANINFKHSFDSTGKELTADLDYGVF
ncbi:MAG: TonB-dependent receptor, partial [Flavisolibacter sp.]